MVEATARATDGDTNMITRLRGVVERGEGVAFRYPSGDPSDPTWVDVSYPELADDTRRLAAGLVDLGLERGDVVAIFSDTRAEWVLADLAAISAGLVVATIYHTSSAEEAQHILENSEASLVFCDHPETLAKVEQVRGELPALKHTVLFSGSGQEGTDGALTLDDLRERGSDTDPDELDRRAEQTGGDDLFTLVYTSGTTGPPKGCMISHRNMLVGLDNFREVVDPGEDPLFYVFLPLAHVLTRLVELIALDSNATLGFWRGDTSAMLDDLAALAPTHFVAVPRIFEKIYSKAYEQVGTGAGAKLMDAAVATGRDVRRTERRGGRVGVVARIGHELADRALFDKVRGILGGRVRLALVGGAPVATELLEFFDACGVLVLEGYGLTETSAAGAINRPDAFRFGTQGPPAPNTEVTLAERSDGEDSGDPDEEGTDPGAEILVRGPAIFRGYYKMPEETREALDDDGWFHTGDVGSFDEDGFLTITGRTKDIIVTSSGKNIPAARIENEVAQSRWIEHAVLYGDNKNYLVALISLDGDELSALAEKAGVEADRETMAGSDAVRSEISDAIDGANENFARIEQVKEFTILPRALSTDHGELTSTLKVKRKIVHDNHRELFEELYP